VSHLIHYCAGGSGIQVQLYDLFRLVVAVYILSDYSQIEIRSAAQYGRIPVGGNICLTTGCHCIDIHPGSVHRGSPFEGKSIYVGRCVNNGLNGSIVVYHRLSKGILT